MLDRAVTEPILQRPRIMAGIGQGVAAGMAQPEAAPVSRSQRGTGTSLELIDPSDSRVLLAYFEIARAIQLCLR